VSEERSFWGKWKDGIEANFQRSVERTRGLKLANDNTEDQRNRLKMADDIQLSLYDDFQAIADGSFAKTVRAENPNLSPDQLSDAFAQRIMPKQAKYFAVTRNMEGFDGVAKSFVQYRGGQHAKEGVAAIMAWDTNPEAAAPYIMRNYDNLMKSQGSKVTNMTWLPKSGMYEVDVTDADGKTRKDVVGRPQLVENALRFMDIKGGSDILRQLNTEKRTAENHELEKPTKVLNARVAEAKAPRANEVAEAEVSTALLGPKLKNAQIGQANAAADASRANADYTREAKVASANARTDQQRVEAEGRQRAELLKLLRPGLSKDGLKQKDQDQVLMEMEVLSAARALPENKDIPPEQLASWTRKLAKGLTPEQMKTLVIDTDASTITVKAGLRTMKFPVSDDILQGAVSAWKQFQKEETQQRAKSSRTGRVAGQSVPKSE
jgi:hypothetical protein